jgi:hypothetical protein
MQRWILALLRMKAIAVPRRLGSEVVVGKAVVLSEWLEHLPRPRLLCNAQQ